MMLCDWQITEEMERWSIGIEPFCSEQLNTNSYDLRLGNYFYLVEWGEDGPMFFGPHYVEDGERIHIPRRGTLLGMTKDLVGTRNNIVAELRSKSTTRRSGITVCDDAGFGDVGYGYDENGDLVDNWTVELTAHVGGQHPFLVVGERFAQVVFFRTGVPDKPYSGQYRANKWPENMVPKKYRDRVFPWNGGA